MFEMSSIGLETVSDIPAILGNKISQMNRLMWEEMRNGGCVRHWLFDSTACGDDIRILKNLSDSQYDRLCHDTGSFVSWFTPNFDKKRLLEAHEIAQRTDKEERALIRTGYLRSKPRDQHVLNLIHEIINLGYGSMISSVFGLDPELAFVLQEKFSDFETLVDACAMGFDSDYTLRLRSLAYLEEPVPQDPFSQFMCASKLSMAVIFSKRLMPESHPSVHHVYARNSRQTSYCGKTRIRG